MSFEALKAVVNSLHEVNPMLGLRGCRLPICYPEIGEMQAQAIIEAAINVVKETGQTVVPEIMVPLVSSGGEIHYLRKLITTTADSIIAKSGVELEYKVGTMIELPRAAVSADRIAKEAEFFSFGTNDLTQTCFGFSRDDAEGKFLPAYIHQHILKDNPFAVLDREGVGRLVMMHAGRIVVDVKGDEKKHLTVPDLLALFEKGAGEVSDAMMLSS